MAETQGEAMTCAQATELAAGFVLGALEPSEMASVRAHLSTCREAHPEFEELGAVVPVLARTVPPATPSPDLGDRILAAARAEQTKSDEAGARAALQPMPVPVPTPAPWLIGQRRPWAGFLEVLRRPAWLATAVAAVLVMAVLGAWNLQLQGQVSGLTAYRDGVAAVLDAAKASGARVAVLSPAAGSGPTGLAAVDPAGRLVIAMRDLTPTTGAQVYEAWLIGADNKPVPAGSFAVGPSGVGTLAGSLRGAEAGVVVALTLEPGPGATTPTLPIIVQGRAGSSAGVIPGPASGL
ncbi:MAG: anti-sigma factor [Chloroflexi bacterium]|nr:anti-sigma factor [Chloroflexota bacterium]